MAAKMPSFCSALREIRSIAMSPRCIVGMETLPLRPSTFPTASIGFCRHHLWIQCGDVAIWRSGPDKIIIACLNDALDSKAAESAFKMPANSKLPSSYPT
ncbi:hypothetical protein ASPWEDRAFT_397237 [Aspergillus wentii DTO 134E9]|uniref:Uncharacterized protein n=1 Tax=Aspergillus wentii DTO 134E9 TaxID=1073089 RepID=A0A1L9RYE4_ASPWE|nr:uncharacterized protein ASPWEDRAFT_397237 [Aspergillus wentii DTO 134E9]OJJ39838.1 hypothetical protein ASPWEDRAFT_397237 [Aspergillus wentii DTO 134E9]